MLRRAAEKEETPFTRAERRRFQHRMTVWIGLMEAKRGVALKVFAQEGFGHAAEFFGRAGIDYVGVGEAERGGLVESARLRVFEPLVHISLKKDTDPESFFSFLIVQFFVVNFFVNPGDDD